MYDVLNIDVDITQRNLHASSVCVWFSYSPLAAAGSTSLVATHQPLVFGRAMLRCNHGANTQKKNIYI